MKNSRQTNSVLNVLVMLLAKFFQIVLTFFIRRTLIVNLGEEILGIDGLFSGILSVLSLADLGINTAIIYALYNPISQKDEKKIAAFVAFFKKAYILVGLFILVVGVLLTPFIEKIVNLDKNIENINLYYVLTIFYTAASYFCSSRRVIFEADQRNRIVTMIDALANVASQVGQVLIILLIKDYIIVLLCRIVFSIIGNAYIYYLGDKEYLYLKKYKHLKLCKSEKNALLKDTGAVLCHKIGGVVVNSTDSIIISAFMGIVLAGYYSNYITVINGVSIFVTGVFSVIIPSIGNLKAETSDVEYHYTIFETVFLANYLLSGFCTVVLFSLINPFISVWLGEKYVFNSLTTFLLCINFYLTTMRYGVGAFCTAGGLFKETIIKPIVESVVNLVVSIMLVQHYGLSGVIIGTIASLIVGSIWVDPYFLFTRWFNKSVKMYYVYFSIMFVIVCMLSMLSFKIISLIEMEGIMGFIAKMVISCVVGAVGVFVTARYFPGFVDLRERLVGVLRRIRKK